MISTNQTPHDSNADTNFEFAIDDSSNDDEPVRGIGFDTTTVGNRSEYSQQTTQFSQDSVLDQDNQFKTFYQSTSRHDFLSYCEALYDSCYGKDSVNDTLDMIKKKIASNNSESCVDSNIDSGTVTMLNGFDGDGRKTKAGGRYKRKAEMISSDHRRNLKRGDLNNNTCYM